MWFFLLVFNLTLFGCASQAAPSIQPSEIQYLRITNAGVYVIKNLVVRFPEDRISFGDISTGETTAYGDLFTYIIDFDSERFAANDSVQLLEVEKDN